MLGLLPSDGSSWFPRENVGEKIGSDLVNVVETLLFETSQPINCSFQGPAAVHFGQPAIVIYLGVSENNVYPQGA